MKYLIILILISIFTAEISAGDKKKSRFSFNALRWPSRNRGSRTGSPSPTRRPTSTSVTSFDPATSNFAHPPTSGLPPVRPSRLPLSRTASGNSAGSQASLSSPGHNSLASLSSGYDSGSPSLHASHATLPPRSRSPSPTLAARMSRLTASDRTKPTTSQDTFNISPTSGRGTSKSRPNSPVAGTPDRNFRANSPVAGPSGLHYRSPSSGSSAYSSRSSSSSSRSISPAQYRQNRGRKPPLSQLQRNQTPDRSTSLLIPPEGWPSPANSEGKAEKLKIDLPMVDEFAKKIQNRDALAGLKGKDASRNQKKIRGMKNLLTKIEKAKQEKSAGGRPRSLEQMQRMKKDHAGCANHDSPDHSCFDYFKFSMYWPPSVALTAGAGASTHSPTILDAWMIHGLWPSTRGRVNDRAEAKCNRRTMKFNIAELRGIKSDLEKLWFSSNPAKSNAYFWKHEWDEHGSCASRSVSIGNLPGYFTMGLNLRRKYDPKRVLDAAGFGPSAPLQYHQIVDLLKRVFKNPQVYVVKNQRDPGNKYHLSEIVLCYNYQFHLLDCPAMEAAHHVDPHQEIHYLSVTDL